METFEKKPEGSEECVYGDIWERPFQEEDREATNKVPEKGVYLIV